MMERTQPGLCVSLQLHRNDVLFSTGSRSVFQSFQTLLRTSTQLQVTPLTIVPKRKRKAGAEADELIAYERQCSLLIRFENALDPRRSSHLTRLIRSAMQQILPLTFTLQEVELIEGDASRVSYDELGRYQVKAMQLTFKHHDPQEADMTDMASASDVADGGEEAVLIPLVKRICVR